MTLRKVPGALALGLLASLVAHEAVFGREHAMGGGYHGLLLELALGGAISLLLLFGLLGWNAASAVVDGSVLATRLTDRLPSFPALATSAALWFAAAEYAEPHHAAAPFAIVALVLAASAWILSLLARGAIALLAAAIVKIFRAAFAAREPSWSFRPQRAAIFRRVTRSRRRFARPPPIGLRCA